MLYVFEEAHEALGTQYQFDPCLELGGTIGTITLYHADTKGISTVAGNYFSNQLKNYASGGHMVGVLLEIKLTLSIVLILFSAWSWCVVFLLYDWLVSFLELKKCYQQLG